MSNVKNENAGFYFWDHKLTPSTLLFLWGQTAEKPPKSINKIWEIFVYAGDQHFFHQNTKSMVLQHRSVTGSITVT